MSARDVFDELRNSLQRDHLILLDPTTITLIEEDRCDDNPDGTSGVSV